jgi:hypothetical protein
MKNLLKIGSYTLATALVFVSSQFAVLAADNNSNGSLTGGQVVGGLALLIAAILVPTMRSAHKAKA